MKYTLRYTLVPGINSLASIPTGEGMGRAHNLSDARYTIQAHWTQFRVEVFNSKGVLVNEFDYRHNTKELIKNYVGYKKWAKSTSDYGLAKFIFGIDDRFTKAEIVAKKTTPDEVGTSRILSQLQNELRRPEQRKHKASNKRIGVGLRFATDKPINLPKVGGTCRNVQNKAGEDFFWSLNHLITAGDCWGPNPIEISTDEAVSDFIMQSNKLARHAIKYRDFAYNRPDHRERQRDAYYDLADFFYKEFSYLPVVVQRQVLRELIIDRGQVPVEQAVMAACSHFDMDTVETLRDMWSIGQGVDTSDVVADALSLIDIIPVKPEPPYQVKRGAVKLRLEEGYCQKEVSHDRPRGTWSRKKDEPPKEAKEASHRFTLRRNGTHKMHAKIVRIPSPLPAAPLVWERHPEVELAPVSPAPSLSSDESVPSPHILAPISPLPPTPKPRSLPVSIAWDSLMPTSSLPPLPLSECAQWVPDASEDALPSPLALDAGESFGVGVDFSVFDDDLESFGGLFGFPIEDDFDEIAIDDINLRTPEAKRLNLDL